MRAIDLVARIDTYEDTTDKVHDLLVEYGKHVLAMVGSQRFEVYHDRDNALQIVVLERYRNDEAFTEHLADPENAVLNGKLADLTDGGSTLQFLTEK